MSVYVYVSKQCEQDYTTHGQREAVSRFRLKVERDQQTGALDRFLPTPFLKKVFGKSFRLLAYEKYLGDDLVVCFLRFFARGGNGEYDDVFRSLESPPPSIRQLIPSDVELTTYIASRRAEGKTVSPTPEPDEVELPWLEQVFSSRSADPSELMVYETREWVQTVRDMKDDHVSLRGLVERLAESRSGTDHIDPTHKVGILYRSFPEHNRILLITPLQKIDAVSVDGQRHRFHKYLGSEPDFGGSEEFVRACARSYPLYLALERELWLAIQRDEEANLALSPEESVIVNAVRSGTAGQPRFPLFINGRAGSGKSTMIQYLACDFLEYACQPENLEAGLHPLYLTCSQELLQTARASARRLMTTHHERLIKDPIQGETLDRVLRSSFRVLREYLLELVPAAVRQESFRPERYVSYGGFCRLWDEKMAKQPVAKRLSPDLTWHTIRTYIKGMRFEDGEQEAPELDPGEYADLPRKQQSVTHATFKEVFDTAWTKWYKPLRDEKYWDDQDLAGWLLRHKGMEDLPTYPAVFCDEAQDFTRVELELLFRLSLFSRRSVPGHLLGHIPFAFAGDPFQTLNPTGFRWESVQASFHDKLIRGMARGHTAKQGLNYQELIFNYRSTEKIVKFCNSIQTLRAALFPGTQVKLQQSWRADPDAPLPARFLDSGAVTRDGLRQADLVIVVNCDEGQEDAYVSKDPLLNQVTEKDETGVARNVYSPVRAKGLEFPNVVLYLFGDTCPAELRKRLAGAELSDNPDKSLPLEYYFNRLYVAASRAKRRLFVVDTPDGMRSFWDVLADPDRFEAVVSGAARSVDWRDGCSYLMEGQTWTREPGSPLPLAQQLRQRGKSEQLPRDLRQARLLFESEGRIDEAKQCLAEALELEGELEKAGRTFQELGMYDAALGCFWKAGDFQSIRLLAAAHIPLADNLKSQVARVRETAHNAGELKRLLDLINSYKAEPKQLEGLLDDQRWHDAIEWVVTALVRSDETRLLLAEWRQVYSAVRSLRADGFAVPPQALAELALRAKRPDDAWAHWDELGNAKEKEDRYHEARAQVEEYPARVKHLRHLGRWPEIVAWWEEASQRHEPLSGQLLVDIVDACRRTKRYDLAVPALRDAREDLLRQTLGDLLDSPSGTMTRQLVADLLGLLMAAAGREHRWAEAVELTSRRGVEAYAQRNKLVWKKLAERLPDLKPLATAFVHQIASDGRLPGEGGEHLQKVTDHLRSLFTHGQKAWTNWHTVAPLRVAGTAVERVGRIVDALEFYEAAEEACQGADDKRFARERLIRCREKRATHLREKERKAADADKVEREVRADRDRWGITTELPDYPTLGAASDAAATQTDAPRRLPSVGRDGWGVGRWKFKWNGATGVLQIEDEGEDHTTLFSVKKQELQVDLETVTPRAVEGGKVWDPAYGGLVLRLLQRDRGATLEIEHSGQAVARLALPE